MSGSVRRAMDAQLSNDAEQARTSYRNAGVDFERCWSADMYACEKPTASY